ncbi:MAG: VCBS repeat-containing protein [Desulfobacterales bacterium]|nr:VCBS repeat-containing protein [Desulfobacterales bacterium]
MRLKLNCLFIFIFSIFISLSTPLTAGAAGLKQILVLPFTINAETDLAYLNRGMVAMLSSRLFHQDQIATIVGDKSAPDLATALKLGSAGNADYVAFGSITIFGKSVSTDLKLVDVDNETTTVNFSRAGNKKGDVITHIDQFAAQVNSLLIGSAAVPPAPVALAPAAPVPAAPAVAAPVAPAVPVTAPAPAAQAPQAESLYWQSEDLPYNIRGMAAADLDGDGRIEIACIDKHNVYIYRLDADGLDKIAEVKNRRYHLLLAIDAVDTNHNGAAEIFVTAGNPDTKQGDRANTRLFSFVVEWNGNSYQKTAENLNWYFRTPTLPDGNVALAGQKRGINDIFLPGIYTLEWNGSAYVQGNRLEVARNQSIFGFTYGEACNDDQMMLAAFDRRDYLRLMNVHGRKQWASGQSYGGSAIFLDYPDKDTFADAQLEERDRLYLPNRLFIQDMDRDGRQEVILINNHQKGTGALQNLKNFATGRVQVLSWHRNGMKARWSSDEITGFLSDIAIGDVDGDGRKEVLYTVVKDQDFFSGDKASFIVAETPKLTQKDKR